MGEHQRASSGNLLETAVAAHELCGKSLERGSNNSRHQFEISSQVQNNENDMFSIAESATYPHIR